MIRDGQYDTIELAQHQGSRRIRKYARKQPWSKTEDHILAGLVKSYGIKKWSVISALMHNRTAKQCRERWKHQLDPTINSSLWTTEEEWMLYLYHSVVGNRWTYLVNFFQGRTDNSIKNQWNTHMRRRLHKYKARLEAATELFKTDEEAFRAKFGQVEARLIEKIVKSFPFRQEASFENDNFTERTASMPFTVNKNNVTGSKHKTPLNTTDITLIDKGFTRVISGASKETELYRSKRTNANSPSDGPTHGYFNTNIGGSFNFDYPFSAKEKRRQNQSLPQLQTPGLQAIKPTGFWKQETQPTKNALGSNPSQLTQVLNLCFQVSSPHAPELPRLSESQIRRNFERLRAASRLQLGNLGALGEY